MLFDSAIIGPAAPSFLNAHESKTRKQGSRTSEQPDGELIQPISPTSGHLPSPAIACSYRSILLARQTQEKPRAETFSNCGLVATTAQQPPPHLRSPTVVAARGRFCQFAFRSPFYRLFGQV
jgi:hypothetical protein